MTTETKPRPSWLPSPGELLQPQVYAQASDAMQPNYIDMSNLDMTDFPIDLLHKLKEEAEEQILLFKIREDRRLKLKDDWKQKKAELTARLKEEERIMREVMIKPKFKNDFDTDSDEDIEMKPVVRKRTQTKKKK